MITSLSVNVEGKLTVIFKDGCTLIVNIRYIEKLGVINWFITKFNLKGCKDSNNKNIRLNKIDVAYIIEYVFEKCSKNAPRNNFYEILKRYDVVYLDETLTDFMRKHNIGIGL